MQLAARNEESRLQIDHQAQEALRDRRIEARKGYLPTLQETISEWMVATTSTLSLAARVQVAYEKRAEDPAHYQEESREWDSSIDESQKVSTELEALRGQVSDAILDILIDTAQEGEKETGLQRLRLVRLFNDPPTDVGAIETANERYNEILRQHRGALRAVSLRIEELLTGEPVARD